MSEIQVGSIAYLNKLKQLRLSAHDQLDLIINHHFQAFIDDNGFLQIPQQKAIQLFPQLAPSSDFYVYFRDLVIAAYPTPAGLATDKLGQQVHLFRSYLDRQNINFIRHYRHAELPAKKTDLQRLMAYLRDNHLRADFKTGANFHNRYHNQFTYPHNMKVQLFRNSYRWRRNPARMIEFIIDIDSESFVSQWNVYHQTEDGLIDANPKHYSLKQLYQVANTESFNYGIPYGGRLVFGKYRGSHQRLDINQPVNSKIRRYAKNYWKYPYSYNNGGNYVDLVKSLDDITTWQKVPHSQRQQIYNEYLAALKAKKISNRGISNFIKKRTLL